MSQGKGTCPHGLYPTPEVPCTDCDLLSTYCGLIHAKEVLEMQIRMLTQRMELRKKVRK